MDAVNRMTNGCILNGGVGSGKSRTGLFYFFKEQGGWIDENGYILCGDNQWVKEYGVKSHNIIGVVTEINRDGKNFNVNDENYIKYYKRWLKLFPIRKPLIKLMTIFRAIKRKMSSR